MIRVRHAVWALVIAPACFHPSYDHPACGPDQLCPAGMHCNAQLICDPDGMGNAVDDAGRAADDARLGAPGDAAPDDAGAVDAATPTGCYAHWFNGDLAIATPVAVLPGSLFVESRDPWISYDGFRLYLSRSPAAGSSSHDIFLATRVSTGTAFATPTLVANLSSSSDDTRPSLTADEQLIALASTGVGGQLDVVMAARPTTMQDFPSPSDIHLTQVNASAVPHYDPFLNADGRRLYLAPVSDSGQQIMVASRPDLDSDFAPPLPVGGIRDAASSDADPAVSPDERVIVFTSTRPGGLSPNGTDLWYATRPDIQHDFGPPKLIPVVNTPTSNEGDPMLTADGCELFFASNRSRPVYQIFSAAISL